MLFFLCCATVLIDPPPQPTIIWNVRTRELEQGTKLNHQQIMWIVGTSVTAGDLPKINREFASNLTWPQFEEFRKIMHLLLTGIIRKQKMTDGTLDPAHPLYRCYQTVLDYRNSLC